MGKKTDIKKMMGILPNMTLGKQKDVIEQILEMMGSRSHTSESSNKKTCESLVELTGEDRSDCPHCHSKAKLGYIVKRGKFNGTQRYFCKTCGRTFVATTKTAFARTRKDADTWRKFIQMTLEGHSLSNCALECGIAYQTAFTWSHKILNVFKQAQSGTKMTGRVELDEMNFPISYKGNHVKGKIGTRRCKQGDNNNMPRKSFQRGSDNTSSSSKGRACVFCMVEDGDKTFYAVVPGTGFMTKEMLDAAFAPHVDKDKSVVLADRYRITEKYLRENRYTYLTLLSNTSDNSNGHRPEIRGDLHLQHINAFHRHIRKFLAQYCGVSTKYPENYISLYVWLKNIREEHQRQSDIHEMSVRRASCADCYITRKALAAYPAVPQCPAKAA